MRGLRNIPESLKPPQGGAERLNETAREVVRGVYDLCIYLQESGQAVAKKAMAPAKGNH